MEEKDFRLISSRRVYDGWIKLRKDEMLLPGGQRASFTYVDGRDGVIVLPITDNGEVVMVRQYRVPWKQLCLELPAGYVEDGETPQEAALRELEEESGHTAAEIIPLAKVRPSVGMIHSTMHLFLARKLSKSSQRLDESERIEVRIVPLEHLSRIVHSGEIDSSMALAYFFAKEKGFI